MIDKNGQSHSSKNGQFDGKNSNDKKQSDTEFMDSMREQVRQEYKQEQKITKTLGKEYVGYKGQKAIDKLMQEKQGHIKGAFTRSDIGDIDLLWGDDFMGLQHIIKRRAEQGVDVDKFLSELAEVVEKGTIVSERDKKLAIDYNGKRAVIAPQVKGHKMQFLLTAYVLLDK